MTDLEAGVPCSDGDPCTHTDVCDGAGGCAGTSYVCVPTQCESSSSCDGAGGCIGIYAAPGTDCDDGLEWRSDDVCNMGV